MTLATLLDVPRHDGLIELDFDAYAPAGTSFHVELVDAQTEQLISEQSVVQSTTNIEHHSGTLGIGGAHDALRLDFEISGSGWSVFDAVRWTHYPTVDVSPGVRNAGTLTAARVVSPIGHFALRIAWPTPVRVDNVLVFDVSGRLVYTDRGTASRGQSTQWLWPGPGHNERPLRPGVYFVRLQGGGSRVSLKVLVAE
jgi:hypothetical protein